MRLPHAVLTESEAWQRDGVITGEQRRAILARYDSATSPAQQASAAVTWLAVLVAGIGAIVLVAWNWTAIPGAVKIAAAAGPMAAFYLWAAMAARARRAVHAERLALLGALFAGAVLFVVDDLFHAAPRHGETMLLWAAVLSATAVLTPSALVAAVAAAVSAWWMVMSAGMPPGPWWFLAIAPMLALSMERTPNRWVASGMTLVVGAWVFFLVLGVWNDQPTVPAIGAVLAGSWLETLARAPAARRPMFARATPALVITLLGLILLLPSTSHRQLPDWRLAADPAAPVVGLLACLACSTAWNAWRTGVRTSRPAALTLLSAVWLIAWFVLPAGLHASTWIQWTWTAAFSAALVFVAAEAVHESARTRNVALLVVGLSSVVIFVIVRVVDARSLVFSGVMLLASAALLWWLARAWTRHPAEGLPS